MRIKNLEYKLGYTGDGYLKHNQGRIVIYNKKILISRGNGTDHMSLLGGLARKYNIDKDKVISNAIRLYYTIEDGTMIISPNRKLDDNLFYIDYDGNMKLIANEVKKI